MSPASSPAPSEYSLHNPGSSSGARYAYILPLKSVRKSHSIGEMSIVQRSSTTVNICGHEATGISPSFLGTSEFFYDSRAGACFSFSIGGDDPEDEDGFTSFAVYENPLITATSRAVISDIHSLMRLCCAVDVPRPSSVLFAILRTRPPSQPDVDPWFKVVRIWTEVDDISETESFDGHKKSFVEYTLNVLFLPDLHTTYKVPNTLMLRRPPPTSPGDSQLSLAVPASPSFPVPGTPITLPSPFHFQLPVMTRLSFNEQGQITYHRDIWDVRDVVRLIPGIRMVLWIVGRASAWGLSWFSHKVRSQAAALEALHEDMNTNGEVTDGRKGDPALLASAQAGKSVQV